MAAKAKVRETQATRASATGKRLYERARRKVDTRLQELSLIHEAQGKTELLLHKLRGLALEQQRGTPQVFLSLREAAKRFGAPNSRMAEVYRRLAREGILTTVRGSRTLLRATGSGRTLQVRGVIGMPLSVTRLTSLRDYRHCFHHLRDALHRRGFMVFPLFFQQGAPDAAFLVDKLKAEKVDGALWLLPDGAERDTDARLRDAGIPFLGFDLESLSTSDARYQVHRERALRAILRGWRSDRQVAEVVVVRASGEPSRHMARLPKVRALIEEEGFRCETVMLPPRGVTAFLSSLCACKNRAVVLPGPPAAVLAWRGSAAAHEVLTSCRVALLDGPIDLFPDAASAPPQVDVVTAEWAAIADVVADEIVSGKAAAAGETVTFQANHRTRVHAAVAPN